MDYYAIDSLEPALKKTTDLLFKPFNLAFWLKLALVVFIMGLGGGGNGGGGGGGNGGGGDMNLDHITQAIMENIIVIAAIVGAVTLIILGLTYIGVVMRFIFLESVLSSKVEIRKGFRKHMSKGFRVFLFELILGITVLSCITIPLLVAYFVLGIQNILLIILFIILALLFLVVPTILIQSFTESFVIPYMYQGRGLIEGWKHLITVIKTNKTQIIVYIIAQIILAIILFIISFMILIVTVLILLIPAVIIGIMIFAIGWGVAASGIFTGAMIWVGVAIAILVLIALGLTAAYLITLTQLPIPVFLRYYTLIFLTKIDKDFRIEGLELLTES